MNVIDLQYATSHFKFGFLSGCQLPPTRAKSPKLGRRKSCSNADKLSEEDKIKLSLGQGNHHNSGGYKEEAKTSGSRYTVINGQGTANIVVQS